MATQESLKRDAAIAASPQSNVRIASANTWGKKILATVLPHVPAPPKAILKITAIQIIVAIFFWLITPASTFPSPVSVFLALVKLWNEQSLLSNLIISMSVYFQAIMILIPLGLIAVVMTSLSLTKNIVTFGTTFRFLGMNGLIVLFTYYVSGQWIRVSLVVFFVGVYLISDLRRIVANKELIPKREYNRTLGMSEWRVLYEVDIRGSAISYWESLQNNQAMSLMFLPAVEALTKSGGGLGTVLLNSQRTWNLDEVYAIQVFLWVLGFFIDRTWEYSKQMFPWYRKVAR